MKRLLKRDLVFAVLATLVAISPNPAKAQIIPSFTIEICGGTFTLPGVQGFLPDAVCAGFFTPYSNGLTPSITNIEARGEAGRGFFHNQHEFTLTNPAVTNTAELETVDTGPMTVTSFPSWAAGVTEVPVHLRLDASLVFTEIGAFAEITFTGLLGGPILEIGGMGVPTLTFMGSQAVIEEVFNRQGPLGTAESTLQVVLHGGGQFVARGSPEFQGEAPEPNSAVLFIVGFLLMIAFAHRKHSPSTILPVSLAGRSEFR